MDSYWEYFSYLWTLLGQLSLYKDTNLIDLAFQTEGSPIRLDASHLGNLCCQTTTQNDWNTLYVCMSDF